MFINGKCHCSNIAFELEWEDEAPEIPARACGCSFCVKHGGVWTSNPNSRLAVAIGDAALVSKYAFGTRTATFHVCSRCGAVPLVTSEIADHLYAVVNVNVFENVDQSWLRRATASFEGEDVESRLARRKRNWIPDVRIAEKQRSVSVETLKAIADAFNAHDLDAIMDFFADDCSLDMPRGPEPWGHRFTGKPAVREGLATRFKGLPDVHYSDDRHWVSGNMGVSEWLLTGTAPEGRRVRVRGCDHWEFRDGKVIRKDSYWKIVEGAA